MRVSHGFCAACTRPRKVKWAKRVNALLCSECVWLLQAKLEAAMDEVERLGIMPCLGIMP